MSDKKKYEHKKQLKKIFLKNLLLISVPVFIVLFTLFAMIYQTQRKHNIQIVSMSESNLFGQRVDTYVKTMEEKEKVLDELIEKQDFVDFYFTKDILSHPQKFLYCVNSLSDFSKTIMLNNSYIETLGIYSEINNYMMKSNGSPVIDDDQYSEMIQKFKENENEYSTSYIKDNIWNNNKRIVFMKKKKFNDVNIIVVCTAYYRDLVEKIGGFDNNVASFKIIKANGDILLENKNIDVKDSKCVINEKKLQDGTQIIFKIDIGKLVKPFYCVSSEMILLFTLLIVLVSIITLFVNYKLLLPFKKINNILSENDADSHDMIKVWNDYRFIFDNITNVVKSKYFLEGKMLEQLEDMKSMQNIALQNQIKPHFIFNTLQVIGFYADDLTVEENKVSYMIEQMSQMMRYSMSNDSSVVKIKEELEYIKSYVMFQQENYYDKFDVLYNVPSNIMENEIVKITLQPIVENAIKYGIKPSDKKCIIEINGYYQENDVILDVLNTGIIIDKEEAEKINLKLLENRNNTTHIGLSNVNKRIKIIFGNGYGVSIYNENNEKTLCRIKIPKSAI